MKTPFFTTNVVLSATLLKSVNILVVDCLFSMHIVIYCLHCLYMYKLFYCFNIFYEHRISSNKRLEVGDWFTSVDSGHYILKRVYFETSI